MFCVQNWPLVGKNYISWPLILGTPYKNGAKFQHKFVCKLFPCCLNVSPLSCSMWTAELIDPPPLPQSIFTVKGRFQVANKA